MADAQLKAAGTLQHKLETGIENAKQEHALMKQNMNVAAGVPRTSKLRSMG